MAWRTTHLRLRGPGATLDLAPLSRLDRLRLALRGQLADRDAVQAGLARLAQPAADGASLAWHLLREGADARPLATWLWPWLPALFGGPPGAPHDTPMVGARPLPGAGAGPVFETDGGHDALLQALLDAARPAELRLRAPIRRVQPSAAGVWLHGPHGRTRCDAVVLALPEPDATRLLPALGPAPLATGPRSELLLHAGSPLGPTTTEIAWSPQGVAVGRGLGAGPTALRLTRWLSDAPFPAPVLARAPVSWPPSAPRLPGPPGPSALRLAPGLFLVPRGSGDPREDAVRAGEAVAFQIRRLRMPVQAGVA